jgi:hypothetical protein
VQDAVRHRGDTRGLKSPRYMIRIHGAALCQDALSHRGDSAG